MAYEVYVKKDIRSGSAAMSVTADGRITFSQRVVDIIQENRIVHVLILFDKERRLLAFQPTVKNDSRAYTVRFRAKGGVGFHARTFFKHIGYKATETLVYPVTWNKSDRLLEVKFAPENAQKVKGTSKKKSTQRG